VWQAFVEIRQDRGEFALGKLTPEEKCIKEAHNVEQKAMQVRAEEIRQKMRNS
jgi:cellobiose-specific phosphotransferase system component IIA